MPSEETVHVSPMEVTPTLGKGTLGTRSFHRSQVAGHSAGESLTRERELGPGQTSSSRGVRESALNPR